MAYNDTPLPNNTPSTDQPLMRQNFQQIAASWNADHIPLGSGSNIGFSNKLTFVDQTPNPPGSAGNQVVEYSRSILYPNAAGTFSELFFQRDGVATEVQMTTGPGNPVAATTGQTYLPGGIIMKWAAGSMGSNPQAISFSTAFPTACFVVVVVNRDSGPSINTYSVEGAGRSGFTLRSAIGSSPGTNGNYYYIALGN